MTQNTLALFYSTNHTGCWYYLNQDINIDVFWLCKNIFHSVLTTMHNDAILLLVFLTKILIIVSMIFNQIAQI